MSLNPFKVLSKKVVDFTLATEVKRLREQVAQQNTAVEACLARETIVLGAVQEICENYLILDNLGNPILSQAAFLDYATARAKVQS